MNEPAIVKLIGEGVERPETCLPLDINYAKLAEWLVRGVSCASIIMAVELNLIKLFQIRLSMLYCIVCWSGDSPEDPEGLA